jgi:hypothetical protein
MGVVVNGAVDDRDVRNVVSSSNNMPRTNRITSAHSAASWSGGVDAIHFSAVVTSPRVWRMHWATA